MSSRNLWLLLATIVFFNTPCVSHSLAEKETAKNKPIYKAEVFKNLDPKYELIYGSMKGDSYYLHYCLPDFVPRGLGSCKRGIVPGEDPYGVQVHYHYGLNREHPDRALLEAGGAFIYPFLVNVDLKGKTPYVVHYQEIADRTRTHGRILIEIKDKDKNVYEGLVRYESVNLPKSWRMWIPDDLDKYRTKLGNPPMFSCGSSTCTTSIDLGNGWLVHAKFNEVTLTDWRKFYVQFNRSISELMEQ
jgi:hypothetical protein